MNIQDVQKIWQEVFPKSNSYVRKAFFDPEFWTFSGRLSKDGTECAGGYVDNDPLTYYAEFRSSENGQAEFREFRLSLLTKPSTPNRVYESVRLRKTFLKNLTEAKLRIRFLAIREFVRQHKNNMVHDVRDKV
jgi:hypothetical protein